MQARERLRVAQRNRCRDACPNITAVRDEVSVAQRLHELDPGIGDHPNASTKPLRVRGKRISGERWDNDIESGVHHFIRGPGQQFPETKELRERARPAMREDDRRQLPGTAADPYKMDRAN